MDLSGKLGFDGVFIKGLFRLRARYFPKKESTQSSPGLCPGPPFVKRCCQNTFFCVAKNTSPTRCTPGPGRYALLVKK